MPKLPTIHWTRYALILTSVGALTGCSYFADIFPDKQKQYRYSAELPPLEIPPDLSASTIDGATGGGGSSEAAAAEESAEAETSTAERTDAASEPEKRRPSKRRTGAPAVTLAEGSDGVPLIESEAPFDESWGNVSRALGRLEIEVTDQNRSDGVFYVYYGGSTKKHEDRGLWGDITGLFSSDEPKAQEFRIKLQERDEITDIFVLDKDGKGVTDGAGLEMLKRMHEKLQTIDKPEPEKKDAKDES
jgi:outer membrane protein assembly factor BamC